MAAAQIALGNAFKTLRSFGYTCRMNQPLWLYNNWKWNEEQDTIGVSNPFKGKDKYVFTLANEKYKFSSLGSLYGSLTIAWRGDEDTICAILESQGFGVTRSGFKTALSSPIEIRYVYKWI